MTTLEALDPGTPLGLAGHLPLKGGDWPSRRLSPVAKVAKWAAPLELPISPLEGEMSGRTEGSAPFQWLQPTS